MRNYVQDVGAVVRRNIIRFGSTPDVFVFCVLQPIMFVLMFSQVFGGAIDVPGVDYTSYLMAGIFAQTVIFGATVSGMFMAQDKKEGLLQRFRTLPMANSAVVVARSLSDLCITVLSLIVMIITGLIVGWRPQAGVGKFMLGIGLLVLFSWCFSWLVIWLGLVVRSVEAFNSATFLVLFPLTFLSNAFVPTETMPRPLQVFADWNPVSALTQAIRELFGNTGALATPDIWSLQHSQLMALIGSAIFLLIFFPLANRAYRR